MDKNSFNTVNVKNVDTAEKQRRVFTVLTMAFFAVILITYLVLANYQVYAALLTIMLLISDLTIVICIIYFFRTGALFPLTCIVLTIILCLCITLVYTGGKESTALYWLMFYPLAAYFGLGLKVGSVLIAVLFFSTTILLIGPEFGQVRYGKVEVSRFFASFSLVILFSGISEYFRQLSHQKIADITLIEKLGSLTDPLTGLANRRYIYDHIQPRLEAEDPSYLPMSVLLIDLDNFKSLNDCYGHDFGDQVLIAFSSMMQDILDDTDIKARYGGEEFIILLPKAGLVIAHTVAEKLRAYVAQKQIPYDVGQSISITCSIGIACLERGSQFSKAIKHADENLYKAKAKGRNLVVSGLSEAN